MKFTDTPESTDPIMIEIAGKRLEIRVDIPVMRRLRRYDPPIDIRRIVDPSDDHGGLYGRMREDPEVTVNIAFEATRHEKDAPDEQAFAEGLGGERLGELTEKVLEAVVRFIPDRKNRAAYQAILDKIDAVETQLYDRGMANLNDPATDQAIEQAIREATSDSIPSGSIDASSSSVASSDSTPEAPGP